MDLRSSSSARPAIKIEAHTDAVNTLSFHPKYEMMFATGSADKSIGVFDMRFPQHGKIHALEGHQDVVTKVDWHPNDSAILASSGDDRRVIFWDISRAGMEQTPEDAEDGPPEMYDEKFFHCSSIKLTTTQAVHAWWPYCSCIGL